MSLLEEGQIVSDRYQVERLLGEGAFAEVYRVRHRFLGVQAMKVFKAAGMTIGEAKDLLKEPRLLSDMAHPNIIRVFDADIAETDGGIRPFFTMEYARGGNLEQFWNSHGLALVPVHVAVDIVTQICRGLAVAHREEPPIVHRDIKPQNILLNRHAHGVTAILSDFGLARHVNPLTWHATARGTRSFKSPEALKNWQSDSCASDVWALGSTLYLLLTDRLPYAAARDFDRTDLADFERPLASTADQNIDVDERLDAIVRKSLAINVSARYKNAEALLGDLDKWKPTPRRREARREPTGMSSKQALGPFSVPQPAVMSGLAEEALDLAGQGQLPRAVELMEQAFSQHPDLQARYSHLVKAWRSGKVR